MILKRAVECEESETIKRFFLKKKVISDDHFYSDMLSFPVKERGRDKKCSMFYCIKMFVGTDSSTLQKGLQNRSE